MNNLLAPAFAAALVISAGSAALAADPIPSSGDTFTIYSEVEGWTVYSDTSTGTCLVEKTDEMGNAVQMGLTKDQAYGYLGVFTTADVDIKKGQEIVVAVDGSVFTGEGTGIKSKKLKGDYSGGYLLTNNPNFVSAIENGQKMVAFPEKTGAFTVDLTGTKKAIEAARKCNMENAS